MAVHCCCTAATCSSSVHAPWLLPASASPPCSFAPRTRLHRLGRAGGNSRAPDHGGSSVRPATCAHATTAARACKHCMRPATCARSTTAAQACKHCMRSTTCAHREHDEHVARLRRQPRVGHACVRGFSGWLLDSILCTLAGVASENSVRVKTEILQDFSHRANHKKNETPAQRARPPDPALVLLHRAQPAHRILHRCAPATRSRTPD